MRRPWASVPLAILMGTLTAACGAGPRTPASGGGTAAKSATSAAASGSSAASTSSSHAASTSGTKTGTSGTTTGLTWSGLGAIQPLTIQNNTPGLAADPVAHPQDLALCLPGGISVSRTGGSSWTTVSTAGVVAATAQSGYPVQGTPTCMRAVADPQHPRTVYATFAAGQKKYGMPPVYSIPLYTTDSGNSWHLVTPPAGASLGSFGQFAVSGGGVLAIFAARGTSASGPGPASVTATDNGGASWHAATLSCPAAGPCVTWGAAASGTGSCAMNGYPQTIERSADGGRTWTAESQGATGPGSMLANSCFPNQLAAISKTQTLLVANGTMQPQDAVRVSDDGGKTWRAVALPTLPGGAQAAASGGLRILPDGTLLQVTTPTTGAALTLQLLAPKATAWCTVPGVSLSGVFAGSMQVIGSQLWWVRTNAQGQNPAPANVPLSKLRCG